MLVDGTTCATSRRGALAEHVALVPQQAFLFDDTVRGNVTLGADVPDDEVWAGAAHRPGRRLRRRAARRPRHPAGGARHHAVRRPAAAALAGPGAGPATRGCWSWTTPPPRSTPRSRRASSPRCAAGDGRLDASLVVAYRKATIALADEVVFLADGRVADQGTHAELLARNPGYADLVNAYEQEQPERRERGRGERPVTHDRHHAWTPASRSPRWRPSRRGIELSPELTEGFGGTLALAVLATARPGRRPDRGAADPRPAAQRAPAGRTSASWR